jgi:hypothetical protein
MKFIPKRSKESPSFSGSGGNMADRIKFIYKAT